MEARRTSCAWACPRTERCPKEAGRQPTCLSSDLLELFRLRAAVFYPLRSGSVRFSSVQFGSVASTTEAKLNELERRLDNVARLSRLADL